MMTPFCRNGCFTKKLLKDTGRSGRFQSFHEITQVLPFFSVHVLNNPEGSLNGLSINDEICNLLTEGVLIAIGVRQLGQ